MARVKMYSTRFCGYCTMAKRLLEERGAEVEILRVDADAELRQEMMELTRRTSVPQIFINDEHVGGYSDLVALERDSLLEDMLAQDTA